MTVKRRIHVRVDSDFTGEPKAWVQGLTLTEVKECRDIPTEFSGTGCSERAHAALRAVNQRLDFAVGPIPAADHVARQDGA